MRGRLFTWVALARDAARQAGRPELSVIAAYWPLADEPDLRAALLGQWVEAGITVALPAVRAPGQPLEFRALDARRDPAGRGLRHPEPLAGATITPELILVPDAGLHRAGRPGGLWRRLLRPYAGDAEGRGHAFTTIGIAWTVGRLDQAHIPEAHDVRLDAILTPDGWVPKAP